MSCCGESTKCVFTRAQCESMYAYICDAGSAHQQRLFVPAPSAVDELDVSACWDPISHASRMIIHFSLWHSLTKAVGLAAQFGQDPSTFISLRRWPTVFTPDTNDGVEADLSCYNSEFGSMVVNNEIEQVLGNLPEFLRKRFQKLRSTTLMSFLFYSSPLGSTQDADCINSW